MGMAEACKLSTIDKLGMLLIIISIFVYRNEIKTFLSSGPMVSIPIPFIVVISK